MIKTLKQARSALSMLNPESVRNAALYPLTILLVAADAEGYAAIEDYLLPAGVSHEERESGMARIFRTGDAGAPERVDIVIYQAGMPVPHGAYIFDPAAPEKVIEEIISREDSLGLPLARTFSTFRRPVVERIIHSVSRENALFAITTALPNIVPSLLELPWAVGEFASDLAFLTMNQIRMAFLVAGACARPVGVAEQKMEIFSIAAAAFGWRAIARELAGKIPLGGGLIPKSAIAYAGTYVIGKGLAHFNDAGVMPTREQNRQLYLEAYDQGRAVAESLRNELPPA